MTYFFEHNSFINGLFLKELKTNTISQFKKITRFLSLFKLSFSFLFFLEIVFSWILVLHFPKSWIIAISIAVILFTIFFYFVFLFYLQAKKPEELLELKERFISACKKNISTPEGYAEHHLSLAYALSRLSFLLTDQENSYFPVKKRMFKPIFNFLSRLFHEEDVFKMREDLLISSVKEHVFQIKETPCDVEVHVSLARSYISLASLYKKDKKSSFLIEFLTRRKPSLKNYKLAIRYAIEEFTILKAFAPNDPWILSQLAKNYSILGLLEEEAREYENLLELSPNDNEILFELGRVYFKLKKNAEGLQIYEALKRKNFKRKDELLKYYSIFNSKERLEQKL